MSPLATGGQLREKENNHRSDGDPTDAENSLGMPSPTSYSIRTTRVLSLDEAAEDLKCTRQMILNLAGEDHLPLATLLPDGELLFLTDKGARKVMSEPDRSVPLRELALYRGPIRMNKNDPMPLLVSLHPESDSPVNIRTLRVLPEDLKHIKNMMKSDIPLGVVRPCGHGKGTVVRLSIPKGTKWREVAIVFVTMHEVSIEVRGRAETRSYVEMGMADSRTKRPNKQWTLLQDFAREEGIVGWHSTRACRANKHRKQRLASTLREFFGIEGEPFELTADRKGWKARFQIRFS